jgi:hypothetical protein
MPAVSACSTGKPSTAFAFFFDLFFRSALRVALRLLVFPNPVFAILVSGFVFAAAAARDPQQRHSPKRDRRCR